MCKISIIIPVYNEWNYTKQILSEIKNKCLLPHELIIIDNGSTDETKDSLPHYTKIRPNVKIIRHDENL